MRSCGWRGSQGRRVEGSAKWGKNTFKRGREGKDDGRAALGSFARGPGRPPHPAALRGPRVLRGWLRNGGQPPLDTRPPRGARGGREARFPQQRVRTRPAASNRGVRARHLLTRCASGRQRGARRGGSRSPVNRVGAAGERPLESPAQRERSGGQRRWPSIPPCAPRRRGG